jgi:signal transduction histidine kinase
MSAWTVLYPEDVSKVMKLLDLDMTRLVIVDTEMRIVYDSFDNEGSIGKYALISELSRALSGKDVFYSRYLNGALISSAAVPVTYNNKIIGAVYIYDYETEQARLISALQSDIAKVSFFITVITAGLAFIFSKMLTDRIKSILKAIKNVRIGQYHYRAPIKGKDELADLGNEFNELVKRLQKTEEMRQRFVSDASHELKTPLAAIRLLTDSIVQNENMDKATLREFIYDIGREAERLTRITEKLLDLTRIDNHTSSINGPTDMKRIIRQALTLLESLAEKKGITLEIQLGEKCIIWANADDVYQVVFNIVENAIKYNNKNGSVTILLFADNEQVRFIVDDTGVGIPEDELPFIFDRFYRVDKARNSEIGGSGLGLSIVQDMVTKHGGTVEVSNREHGGTRFDVRFPLYKTAPGEKIR